VDVSLLPRASDIARIAARDLEAGKGVAATQAVPVYLRNEVVHRR
jgi:tRNA threonylcarbamoyladenosine biosynthesis protein TsaB